jgi:hypothetical protein
VQSAPHVCIPLLPQGCVAVGVQAPSPEQAPQSDQFPVFESQVRVSVPQRPQPWDEGPGQIWFVHSGSHWQLPPQL